MQKNILSDTFIYERETIMEPNVGNVQLIQKMNRLKVLDYIRKHPDVARPAISQATGLSLSSMTNITSYLLNIGLVTESGMENAQRVGRKSTLLRFHAEAYGLICIFIKVGTITIAYTDLEGNIHSSFRTDLDSMSSTKVIGFVREHVEALLSEHGREHILGIGIAISGLVLDNGRFVLSSSLKWKEFDLKTLLETETGLPVFIENVTVLKAVRHFCCDRSRHHDNMLLVDIENGIGAIQFYQGELNRAMLGELGHTTVEKDGEPCFCGNKGCLEAMCSEQRVLKLYEKYSGTAAPDMRSLQKKFAEGDVAAKQAIIECAEYLGIGLANLVNLCKPSAIVINTGEFGELPYFLEYAEEIMRQRAYPVLVKDLQVEHVSTHEADTILGAAFNLCDRLFDLSFPGNIIG